jgi:hypothetical protein
VPEDTPTPDTIAVTGAFGEIYWGYEQVRARLGAPTSWSGATTALQLGFQHGEMILREDTNTIYVLLAPPVGVWNSFQDTATQYPPAEPGPEDGLWVPGGAFGFLWRSDSVTASQLGFAYGDTATYVAESQTQSFEGGEMIVTPQSVYVVYNDGTWEFYPNTTE